MIELKKDRYGNYDETSIFIIDCYKHKYGYKLVTDAIAHIERDNENESAELGESNSLVENTGLISNGLLSCTNG